MSELLKNQSIHRHIYLDLERKIVTGEIGFMDQLPPLPRLCDQYGVSEAPIRRALDELARDGMIEKRRGRGKGTVVIKRLVPTTLRCLLMLGEQGLKSQIEYCHEVFDLIAGIQKEGYDRGCRVQMVSPGGFDCLPSSTRSTGYLVIAMGRDDYRAGVAMAERYGAPWLLVNSPEAWCADCAVRVDMRYGAYSAVNHLFQIGHRRIAYIGKTENEWAAPRFEGYCQALAGCGLPFRPELVRATTGFDETEDEAALVSLMAESERPTALFAISDYRALHLLNACRRLGLDVPGQISICGYDDIWDASAVEPGLTTVHHPRYELGQLAVERLCAMIHDKESPSDHVVRPHLVVRESCAPPVA